MKKRFYLSKIATFFAATAVLILTSVSASAHGVYADRFENGKIRFYFDDNMPVTQGEIEVFESSGKLIAADCLDDNGTFDYSQYEKAAKITMTDMLGHRCECDLSKPQKTSPRKDTTEFYLVGLITLVLIGIAVGHFGWNSRKKKTKTATSRRNL
ncbi:MAG: hypothetical protein LBT05_09590 [Planctomycetaceae bacterium]|nr:hypothetical protein [Planctomycetaceae bacterium]